MLAKFTETEALEGNIYACDQCNGEGNTPLWFGSHWSLYFMKLMNLYANALEQKLELYKCLFYLFAAAARRRTCSKTVILTEAQKQLMVYKLPQVLRLHLKRFR